MQSFDVVLYLESPSGRFRDPFYPWIEYGYEAKLPSRLKVAEDCEFAVFIENCREERVSGAISASYSIAGGDDRTVERRYALEEGSAMLLFSGTCRFKKEPICIRVLHISSHVERMPVSHGTVGARSKKK